MSQFKRALARRLADPEVRAGYEETRERLKLLAALVKVRKDLGLSQQEVADRMGVGQSTLSQLEGSADPRLSTVQRYARAVGAKVSFVMTPPVAKVSQWMPTEQKQQPRQVWKPMVTRLAERSVYANAA